MPAKRVRFDDETWAALDLLARDRMAEFQELADEAFADLLKKHGRPTDLTTALRRSAQAEPAASAPTRDGVATKPHAPRRARRGQGVR